MKTSWTQLLSRVDALSLRERVMLFASVAFVVASPGSDAAREDDR